MLSKETIIGYITQLGAQIGRRRLGMLFQDDREQKDARIGLGQFREIAALCLAAECFEEIALLIRYNTAKAAPGKSWASLCGSRKFGDLIVGCMQTIRSEEPEPADVLKDLSLFFGYLYWQARVWSAECADAAKGGSGDAAV